MFLSQIAAGKYISLGGVKWKVINPSSGLLLLDNKITSMVWDSSGDRQFNPSKVGTLANYLNSTFFNNLSSEKSWILDHLWDTRSEDGSRIYPDVTAKVGLLTRNEYVSIKGTLLPNTGEGYEWWLITPSSSMSGRLFAVGSDGHDSRTPLATENLNVRPAVYVRTDLFVSSGSGTLADPYTLSSNSPPTLTVNNANITASPAIGRSIITLSGTVTDTNRDTITISATLDGKTKVDTVTGDISSQSWILTWGVNSDNISQGIYRNIVVTANDGAGGVASITYTGTITVDKTAPIITISGIVNGAAYQNSVTPTFSANDAGGSGLMTVTATLNGAPFTSGTAITTSGAKTLIVTATDNAGNQSQQTVNFSVNKTPTLTLTSPTDNQTLSEGNAMAVQGSASDVDSGNVVTAKFKINNGPVRALQSGVSNGSTPISFAKNLIYRDKRLWDGNTDVIGADLAENTDHTLTVWAEDDQGGKSTEVNRKFIVIWNRPPVIDGQNKDLGTMEAPPVEKYTVTEPESNPFTVTEKINGVVIRTFPGVAGRQETITIPHDKWLLLEPGVLHRLTIEATDDQGMMSTREFTLTRFVDKIIWMMDFGTMESATKEFFTTDVAAKRLLLTPVWNLPPGANLLVEVCNNAYDALPTWEDATIVVKLNRAHLFNNTTKTAAKWGINFRFRIEKGTANLPVYFKGIGGAFD